MTDLPGYCAPPFPLMPAASTSKLSVQVLDFEEYCLLIQLCRLICGFCSSGQRFAHSFLRIPPRDGHPCCSANDSPCWVRRGLSPPNERALPGAQRNGSADRRMSADPDINHPPKRVRSTLQGHLTRFGFPHEGEQTMSRQPFGRRINTWLAEAPTEQFTDNKWRFWFLALVGFQLLNATLTALVFDAGGNLQNGMGAIVLAVGA